MDDVLAPANLCVLVFLLVVPCLVVLLLRFEERHWHDEQPGHEKINPLAEPIAVEEPPRRPPELGIQLAESIYRYRVDHDLR